MGWTVQTRPDVVLSAGTVLKFTLHFSYLPFVGVTPQLIQSALERDTPLYVTTVTESLLSTLGLADEWEVQGSIRSRTTVGELSAAVSNSLNKWYSWGVGVMDLKTETWVPALPGPSTQTTISLTAIAIIVIIGFLIARKGGLL